jgi:hypothetical protein
MLDSNTRRVNGEASHGSSHRAAQPRPPGGG